MICISLPLHVCSYVFLSFQKSLTYFIWTLLLILCQVVESCTYVSKSKAVCNNLMGTPMTYICHNSYFIHYQAPIVLNTFRNCSNIGNLLRLIVGIYGDIHFQRLRVPSYIFWTTRILQILITWYSRTVHAI